jgi:ribosomal protein S18 acetylase RimI-like enzyme
MSDLTLVDLDQRPELAPATAALFAAYPPGQHHVVHGFPEHMGLAATADDFTDCLGTLVLLNGIRVVGALALCPYSKQQVTLWGPVASETANLRPIGMRLLQEARVALRLAGFESMRSLVDTRNRGARALLQSNGFSAWKDDHLYEHDLATLAAASAGGEAPTVRLATADDHDAAALILREAFPDSDHCDRGLRRREKQGFRHYVLSDHGAIVAAAAVDGGPRRSWIKLLAVAAGSRGRHLSRRLLGGILAGEAAHHPTGVGLEVLGDNAPAVALYERCGFRRRWTATIMTAPL